MITFISFLVIFLIFIIIVYKYLLSNHEITFKQISKTKCIELKNNADIDCKTRYEININDHPQKEIDIDETYHFDKSDINYYKDIIEEYNTRLNFYANTRRNERRNEVLNNIEPILNIIEPLIEPLNIVQAFQGIDQEIYLDNQNVHNHTVQKMIHNKYNNLNKHEYNGDIIYDIENYNPIKKEKVKNILNQIRDRNSNITNLNNETELDVLYTVWANAQDDNEKQAILNELEDSVNQYGDIVCPTGTTTRLINATYINNPEEMPRTKSMIHQEMMNSASNIRNNLEDDKEYNVLNDQEKDKYFKNTILEKYKTDYKDILEEKEIQDMTNEWIDLI
jgi:hypothetical protein